jgi:uncharacterized protein YjbJ (UPF0337 family)
MDDDIRRDRRPEDEQREGLGEEVKGKAQQAWGALTDDERLEAEGEANETKGKLRQTKGDVERTVEKAKDRFTN